MKLTKPGIINNVISTLVVIPVFTSTFYHTNLYGNITNYIRKLLFNFFIEQLSRKIDTYIFKIYINNI